MVYDDVPDALLDSGLLKEMMSPLQWKVLPNRGNVVRLGYLRMLDLRREYLKEEEERALDKLLGLAGSPNQ